FSSYCLLTEWGRNATSPSTSFDSVFIGTQTLNPHSWRKSECEKFIASPGEATDSFNATTEDDSRAAAKLFVGEIWRRGSGPWAAASVRRSPFIRYTVTISDGTMSRIDSASRVHNSSLLSAE